MKYFKSIIFASAAMGMAACAQSVTDNGPVVDASDKVAVEKIVHDYIMENPGLVMEALLKHEKNQDWDSINDVKSAIYNENRDIVVGPANAKVTIVEFFDYNCSACKSSTNWLADAMEEHPNDVRVIFKEAPILDGRTRTSRNAAAAALASAKQGKYFEMHMALMTNRKSLTQERIEEIAKENGVDVARMNKDMEDPAIKSQIDDTMTLIGKIRPFSGTPFFLFEDEFVPGASITRLEQALDKALAN